MSERGSQAIHRAMSVFDCFTADHPVVSLTEIASQTGLTMPTAHRMVKALQSRDLLVQDPASGHYSLGPAVMRLARIVMQRNSPDELLRIALPYLEQLRVETQETVGLHWPVGSDRVCVAELTSRHPMRMATGIGSVYPVHVGAAGKALVAWTPEHVLERIIGDHGHDPLTSDTITEPGALRRELKRVRNRGWAKSQGETVEGATALAGPIFAPGGVVAAAINVTGPTNRLTKKRIEEAVPALLEVTRTISLQLGFRPDEPEPVSHDEPDGAKALADDQH